MLSPNDTISALATPVGTAAIAVVRASGPGVAALTAALCGTAPTPRVATRADYRDRNGVLLDDVLFTFYQGPRSYTGEDSLEISAHGNPFIAQKILEDLFARGCRPAAAGEFTQRAFLHGQLDLSQAEAVMDLIHARSERALAAANQQLRGALGRHMNRLVDGLLGLLARIEAYIDFPEEDLPDEDRAWALAEIGKLAADTSQLLATSRYGEVLRDGMKTVIVGEPNAGKSSLLNRLVGHERAIVSPEPGTTRDYLEERLIIGAHSLRLIDTAGLNPAPAPLEQIGMEKALARAAEADLILLVLDGSRPIPALPDSLRRLLTREATLIVRNKADLGGASPLPADFAGYETIAVSALTGAGLEALQAAIAARADRFAVTVGDEMIAINARHADALTRAQAHLAEAGRKLAADEASELVASELRGALESFGEIAGRIDNERVLDHLFATFCIGK